MVIGSNVVRKDALEKVSGSAVYAGDIHLEGMLHGKLLRSSYAHARILRIDVASAARQPGVKAILTSKDTVPIPYGLFIPPHLPDHILFTDGVARYTGDVIAAVAADSFEAASLAAEKIDVTYEPLKPVLSIDEAMGKDAPVIHENIVPRGRPRDSIKNLCCHTRMHKGDVRVGFEKADIVVEEDYETSPQSHAYLEPRAAIAQIDSDGKLVVWSSTQSPSLLRMQLSHVLQMPMHKVRVVATHVGGGFGAKVEMSIEPYCALLAMKARRPVKIALSRHDEFAFASPRPAMKFWIKSGIKKNGLIVAREGRVMVDCGAYASDGPAFSSIGVFHLHGPYRIANVDIEGYCIYTNKQPAGAFRGPGSAEPNFAVESHTDNLAVAVGMDPLEFRLVNAWEDGDEGPTGQLLQAVGLKDTLRVAAEKIGWKKTRLGEDESIGLSCGMNPTVTFLSSGATIKMNEDGTVNLVTGAADAGTGAGSTTLAMIVAEELAIPMEDVSLTRGDTNDAPWDGGAVGSRTTYGAGTAVLSAAKDVKKQLLDAAAKELHARVEDLEIGNRCVARKGIAKTAITLRKLVDLMGGQVLGKGTYVPPSLLFDENQIDGFYLFGGIPEPTFLAHAVRIHLDRATGQARVLKYVAVHDAGRVLNPVGLEGVIEGGVVQGLGYALLEGVTTDDSGFITNTSFGYYKIPTSLDVPRVETAFIETHPGGGPYGAKGSGEAGVIGPAAAVNNAIFHLTGRRVKSVPLNPQNIYASLVARGG